MAGGTTVEYITLVSANILTRKDLGPERVPKEAITFGEFFLSRGYKAVSLALFLLPLSSFFTCISSLAIKSITDFLSRGQIFFDFQTSHTKTDSCTTTMVAADRKIQRIDPASLSDLTSRITYLKSFLNFTDTDGAAIQASKDVVAPAVPAILDTIYTHLLSFDITAKAFVPRQPEQSATDTVANTVEDLYLEHPTIKHRKDFLKTYLVKLVSNSNWADDSPFWSYLDKVGIMHTGEPGFKHREKRPELRVEYMHMAALLGFVQDIVIKAVMGTDLDSNTKTAVLTAFNKLLWIQNDLFARHYVVDRDTKTVPKGVAITE